MDQGFDSKDISVVIPTFNRAALLAASLASLARQTISGGRYEVIVVDDGSNDATSQVCDQFSGRMPLKYLRIDHRGISAAKNAGLGVATGPIVLFFDDDDVADEQLLSEHVRTHQEHPEENVAALGYTTWDPALEVTPLMEWLTEFGGFLFSYRGLTDGQVLPFSYFWGGRSSCKRSLLLRSGGFNEQFLSIAEDIELGYRLNKYGLSVVFNRGALSYMARSVNYDEFWRRSERVGQALHLFSRLHCDPVVQDYCTSMGTAAPWDDDTLELQARRVRELESSLGSLTADDNRQGPLWELQDLYWWTFTAVRARAFAEAKRLHDGAAGRIARGDAQASRLQSELHRRAGEREATIRALRAEFRDKVAERDAIIKALQAELHAKVTERDAIIQALQAELQVKVAERDAIIQALQAEFHAKVTERDAIIQALQADVEALRGELEATTGALSEVDRRLGSVLSSKSWRWTAPLRTVLRPLRRP